MPPLMPPLMLEGVALASLRGGVLLTVRTRLDRGWYIFLIYWIQILFDLLAWIWTDLRPCWIQIY